MDDFFEELRDWVMAIGAVGLFLYAQAQRPGRSVPAKPLPRGSGGTVSSMSSINLWAEAVAQVEGFYKPGSRPARNHNPGDLKFAGQANVAGQDAQGFAIFNSDADGWAALNRQLAKYIRDFPRYSILQAMAHYLGQHDPTADAQGNAFAYASFVADKIGVPVSTPLAKLVTM